MTSEQANACRRWLYENQDKWDNKGGRFVWLVPENEVPPEVIQYIKSKDERQKKLLDRYNLMKKINK